MKSRIVKYLMALLGFGGVTTSCLVAEYGCPHADYKVHVTAYNNDGSKPIMGLKSASWKMRPTPLLLV
ncbi:MAG: hypothetical protein IKY63_01715 [Tidjanibacter sp.]|nr:hypothetical protein [Tidjanibacter sp.]